MEKQQQHRRPDKRTALLVLLVFASLFIGGAITLALENVVYKPRSFSLSIEETDFYLMDFGISYDTTDHQWKTVDVTIKYNGTGTNSAEVYVYIYDSVDTEIATGHANTGSLTSGSSTTFTITLGWTGGKDLDDAVSSRITVVQD